MMNKVSVRRTKLELQLSGKDKYSWLAVRRKIPISGVSYSHSHFLRFLFDVVSEHEESNRHVMDWKILGRSRNGNISDLKDQTRLLF